MSTTPGDSTWTDAGLLPVDDADPTDLVDGVDPTDDEQPAEAAGAAPPADPDAPVQRPDADEADVLDQRRALPDDGTDDHRG